MIKPVFSAFTQVKNNHNNNNNKMKFNKKNNIEDAEFEDLEK